MDGLVQGCARKGVATPDWRTLTMPEKLERHRLAAEVLEEEAAACLDPAARRHLLKNAQQHRFCALDLVELHEAALLKAVPVPRIA